MAATPLLMLIEEKCLRPLLHKPGKVERSPDVIEEQSPVILAGIGRFGNFVGRLLRLARVPLTVIDNDSDHIDFLARIGIRAYYGDACRIDLLEAAGAHSAKVLIIAFDDPEKVGELVRAVRKHFPQLRVLVRASDRQHQYELIEQQVDGLIHQHAGSAIRLGEQALRLLGFRAHKAHRIARAFEKQDFQSAHELAGTHRDEESYVAVVRARLREVEDGFEARFHAEGSSLDAAWNNDQLRSSPDRENVRKT